MTISHDSSPYRSVDFVIFAVPRSGTTALVNALNLHPDLFCGNELDLGSHDGLHYPDYFSHLKPPTEHKRNALTTQLQNKPNPKVIGNKHPRYFLDAKRLQQICQTVPDIRPIWLYRPARQFVRSWNRRADSPSPQWHAGQTGVFGLLELLLCLNTTLKLKNPPYVVPYEAMFFTHRCSLRELLAHLGLDTPTEIEDTFLSRLFCKNRAQNDATLRLRPEEQALCDALQVDEIDRILNHAQPYPLEHIRPQLQHHLSLVHSNVIRAFHQGRRTFTPAQQEYFARWIHFPEVEKALGHPWLSRTRRYVKQKLRRHF